MGEFQYLEAMSKVINHGEHRADRTGTGTISMFSPDPLVFRNVEERFPLITTKKMAWKSILAETLWFVQGRFDLESLRADGCKWWDDWEREDGTIGPGYGYQLRYWPTPHSKKMIQVKVREDAYSDFQYPYITEWKDKVDYDLNSEECWAVGFLEDLNTPKIEIQFKSGYLTTTTRANWRTSIKKGTLLKRDGYQPSASGVGFKGYPKSHDSRTYNLWYNMIARCYNSSHPQYRFYGARGVTVSPVWHSFEMFLKTLPLVIGYHEWVVGGDLHLDKDYYGSNVYSPNTCVFITPQTNKEMSLEGNAFSVRGELFPSTKSWENRTGGDYWYAQKRWESGNLYQGLSPEDVSIVPASDGHLWRKEIFRDQLAWVINEIKTNPTSRRLVMTMWNAGELDNMALPPCHGALIQFYVAQPDARNNLVNSKPTLHLAVDIRSSDMFLGLPTNIAGYALLLKMVAHVTGTVAGDLTVRLGDAHVYKNHIEQARTQVPRMAYPEPKLTIDPSIKDIDALRPEHFTLTGYRSHGKIPAPISV